MERGPIEINLDWCKTCGICIHVCPKNVFERSAELGRRGTRYPVAARPGQCIRCKVCELMCPDMAIAVQDRKPAKPKSVEKEESPQKPKEQPKPSSKPEPAAKPKSKSVPKKKSRR